MCGSSARTDLYGGQLAIAVPTVTGLTPIENSQARKVNAGEIPADRVGRDNMFHSWELALRIEERQLGRRVHPSGKVAVPPAA